MTIPGHAHTLAVKLVETIKAQDDLHDPRVEQAFLAIPRHEFIPEVSLEEAYANDAIPIKRDRTGNIISSVSQPSIIAQMLEQLQVQPGMNVLEIGTATGYNAALIRYLVGNTGRVTSLELDYDLIERAQRSLQGVQMNGDVTIVQGDGAAGYAPRASYDRIIATASVWDVPPAWERQLKRNGRLVTPIWLDALQISAAFQFDAAGSLVSHDNLPCWFVRLRGLDAGPGLSTYVGGTMLELVTTEKHRLDGAALQYLMQDYAELNYLDMPMRFGRLIGGFLPHLTLNASPEHALAYYVVDDDAAPYGIRGAGFALIMPGSACFIPFNEGGAARCFGSADAFITVQEKLQAWRDAGEPGMERLRLRLSSPSDTTPHPGGKVFARRYHTLHAWFE
ncbi:MAG: rRNA adenine N-6-methyltransferase family protein [Anaerolineae bacterium]